MIPVTILTGFLGSGKTTLLNHLLRSASGKKIAVVENEFGSAGIDADLIETSTEELIELSNGCMCCTVRKDFLEAVTRLLESGKEIDHIVIEASGMSEPLPIAQSFLMESLGDRVELDSIICVVDAANVGHSLVQESRTAFGQLEHADFVIVNKSDLVSSERKAEILDTVRRVNYHAPVIEATYGKVPLEVLLDTHRIRGDALERIAHASDAHSHSETMSHYVYESEGEFDLQRFAQFGQTLPHELYRAKWFLYLKDAPGQRFVLQKAGGRFDLYPDTQSNPAKSGKERKNKIVFIGEKINPFTLSIELNSCIVSPSK